MLSLLKVFPAGVLLMTVSAFAQVPSDAPEQTTSVRAVTSAEYLRHIESLKVLVQACQKNAAECDAKKVGDDERVEGGGFQTRWSWLRDTLTTAHNPALPERDKILQEASARLDEDAVLVGESSSASGDAFQRARKKTDDVLSRPEFRTVEEQSYIEREIAKFWQWVAEVFGGVSRFGKRSPWLVPLMEWSSITLAAAGLLTWVFRTMRRQRLAVRIESSTSAEVWQKESDNWAELARAEGVRIAQEMLSAARSMGYGGIQGVQVSAPFGRYAVAAEVIADVLPQTSPKADEENVQEDLKVEGLQVGNV